jgi:hypothetical protein
VVTRCAVKRRHCASANLEIARGCKSALLTRGTTAGTIRAAIAR